MTKRSKNTDDPRKESIETGEVTTDTGHKVEPVSPAIPHGAEYAQEPENDDFTDEDQLSLCGELKHGGDEGWLPLDKEGNVTGPAKKGIPPEGQFATKVFRPVGKDHLLTPAGAPIQKRMNPDPTLMREHELADEAVTKGKKAADD